MKRGETLSGRFELDHLAGSGAMGAVYRATDLTSNEAVAVKLLRDSSALQLDRFTREARALSELQHPGVVRYVAHGVDHEQPYLVMEWLDGEDLAARLARAAIDLEAATRIVADAASALAAAHARGITHRDVKPSNLFLTGAEPPSIKIVDFGIARLARASLEPTASGLTMGTPGYMAPEQARGDAGVGPAADVFSLGCVLFECLTGRATFEGDHAVALLAKILLEPPPRLLEVRPDLPEELDGLVSQMLAKRAADRPSAQRVAESLRAIRTPTRTTSPRGSRPPRVGHAERRVMAIAMFEPPRRTSADATVAPLGGTELEVTAEIDGASVAAATRVAEAVRSFGARSDVLADGSILVSFREGSAATDLARVAARCCLALRALLPRHRIAFAVGLGETASRSPLGPAVDRAASMLAQAPPQDLPDQLVHVDSVAAGLLGPEFDVVAYGSRFALRGEVTAPAQGVRTLLGKPTPCVGRERELAVLAGLFQESVEEPVSRAVLVTALPGVGKSRLRVEFLSRLGRTRAGCRVWTGRADPVGAGSPFGLLAEAVRDALGVVEGEPLPSRRARVEHRLAETPLSAADRQRLVCFLGELIGTPFPADAYAPLEAARQSAPLLGDQMRRAFEDFVRAESSVAPVVLVLEDLHWGDASTTSFVESALRVSAHNPFFVMALARPEVHQVFPGLWSERHVQELRLGELSPRAGAQLANYVLPDLAQSDIKGLVARSAGNAFYLEELIRATAEGRPGKLPETALAMAQARLEALDPDARRVLRAASVFGETLWAGGVARLVADLPIEALRTWLEALERNETITHRRESRFPGEEEYAFRHALVRQAAYELLTADDARVGHDLAGQWLESVGEGSAVVLAEHFEHGGRGEKAVAWWLRAAEDALQGNDLGGTLDRVARGLRGGAKGTVRGRLLAVRAEALVWRGENADAIAAADEALPLLDDTEHGSELVVRTMNELVKAFAALGDYDQVARLGKALSAAGSARAARIEALANAASALWYGNDLAVAECLTARVEELCLATDLDLRERLFLHRVQHTRAGVRGRVEEALSIVRGSIAEAEQLGDVRMATLLRSNYGNAASEIGLFELAAQELTRARSDAERLGTARLLVVVLNNLGWVLSRLGRFDEALPIERSAVEMAERQGNRRLESASRAYLSLMLTEVGDVAAATEEAERAAGVAPSKNDELYAMTALAAADVRGDRATQALAHASQAMELFRELGAMDEGESILRATHVEALLLVGDVPRARTGAELARSLVLERASHIEDAGLRDGFLHRVPENARVLDLAARLVDSVSGSVPR